MINEIIFDSEIYEKKAIVRAIDDYRRIARIEIKQNEGYYTCKIMDSFLYDIELIRAEFANYVLFLTVRSLNSNETP